MSKFNNPSRALAPSQAQPVGNPPPPAAAHFVAVEPVPPAPATAAAFNGKPVNESPFVSVGFALFCMFMISGVVNDWAFLMFGGKGYISFVMVVLTPLAWLISGNSMRGFRDRVGVVWLLFLVFIVAGLPFSVYKTASLNLLIAYLSRSLCYFFYIVAFVTTLKRARQLMFVNVVITVMILISCVKFGQSAGGDERFRIPGSMFSGNANDLALQLTLGMTEFLFLFYLTGAFKKAIGVAGILVSMVYMLKTGSRGCLVAVAILLVFVFIVSKQRLKLALVVVPILLIAFFVNPSSASHRLKLMLQPSQVSSKDDLSAIESQMERMELLKTSIHLTLTHPIFGVGVGQFSVYVMGDAAKNGQWAPFLGTHNSYTQVSSECGIPALLCYLAVIIISIKTSYRMYRQSAGKPQYKEIEGLAFCLFSGVVVYAVSTFFFHIAYTGLLPLLSGQIVALYLITDKGTLPLPKAAPVRYQPSAA